jgi:hypothetical protein
MSKNKDQVSVSNVTTTTDSVPSVPTNVAPSSPPVPRISEEDRAALELAKARRETVLAQTREAIAKNDTSDLAYRYLILQLYNRYGLTERDAISEDGNIIIGGAAAAQANQQVK